jgi:hypothetical protein
MRQTEYLSSVNIHLDPGALQADHYQRFYSGRGLDAATTEKVVTQGHGYLKMVTGLPPTFRRLISGEQLQIGGIWPQPNGQGGQVTGLISHFRLPKP